MEKNVNERDTQDTTTDHEPLDIDEFFNTYYRLFAVVGVLSGLSVYLYDFRRNTGNESIEIGIASALIIFLLTSTVLLSKITNQIKWTDEIDLYRIVPYGVLIAGIGGLIIAVLSISTIFPQAFTTIFNISVATIMIIAHIIIFPWKTFENPVGYSEEGEQRISDAPNIAINLAIFEVIALNEIFPAVYNVWPYDTLAIISVILTWAIFHYITSFLLIIFTRWTDPQTSVFK